MTDAGRLNTAQCQNPLAVGASGSYTVTAKLFVSGGKPDHVSWGETSSPPSTPNTALALRAGIGTPSATSVLETSNEGTAGRNEYGSGGTARSVMARTLPRRRKAERGGARSIDRYARTSPGRRDRRPGSPPATSATGRARGRRPGCSTAAATDGCAAARSRGRRQARTAAATRPRRRAPAHRRADARRVDRRRRRRRPRRGGRSGGARLDHAASASRRDRSIPTSAPTSSPTPATPAADSSWPSASPRPSTPSNVIASTTPGGRSPRCCARFPASPRCTRWPGWSNYRLGRWRDAVKELEAAQALNPRVDLLPVLADSYRALKRWSDVERIWTTVREISPAHDVLAEARIVAAGAQADRGDLAGALRTMAKVPARPRQARPRPPPASVVRARRPARPRRRSAGGGPLVRARRRRGRRLRRRAHRLRALGR